MKDSISSIPVSRVIDRLDSYLSKNDYDNARRHLEYWYREAKAGNDRRGLLTVLNEQIGLYRKLKLKDEGITAVTEAVALARELGGDNSVFTATTYLNSATALKSFGNPDKALTLYEQAKAIYEAKLEPSDTRLGGLYNNMALTLTELECFDEAEKLFFKAIDIMSNSENGKAETAITYLNLADLISARYGTENGEKTICGYLEKAESLLNDKALERDGYYAFVCEKCAPVFGYYGYFMTERELNQRAREIYERA